MEHYSPILKLPANQQGKDYVIGDLHGCLDLLQQLLQAVQFNPSLDRLFSVGDLIDRGPNSMGCLQLLDEPWFYAAQGNHEKMLLEFFQRYQNNQRIESLADSDDYLNGFLLNGGDWVENYFLAEQQRMSEEFDHGLQLAAAMPLLLIVGDDAQRFHVIHAELAKPPFKALDSVWLNSDIDQWLTQNSIPAVAAECLLWARALMSANNERSDAIKPGLSATFCGHTFDAQPRQILSHICLDTGAFLSCDERTYWQSGDFGLTLYDIHDNRWLSASYQRQQLIDGVLPVPAIPAASR